MDLLHERIVSRCIEVDIDRFEKRVVVFQEWRKRKVWNNFSKFLFYEIARKIEGGPQILIFDKKPWNREKCNEIREMAKYSVAFLGKVHDVTIYVTIGNSYKMYVIFASNIKTIELVTIVLQKRNKEKLILNLYSYRRNHIFLWNYLIFKNNRSSVSINIELR